jgi:hypothetical protein
MISDLFAPVEAKTILYSLKHLKQLVFEVTDACPSTHHCELLAAKQSG